MKKRTKAILLNTIALLAIYFFTTILIANKGVNNYVSGIIITVLITIIMTASLNVTTGLLGQLALGHAGFMAIGAYASALFTRSVGIAFGLSLPISLLLGGLMAAVFGFLIGTPALRLTGDYLAIITLGFGEIIRVVIENLEFTGGAAGLTRITRMSRAFSSDTAVSTAVQFSIVFWITVVIIASIFTLGRSRHGRAIISIRENVVASEAIGIPTTRYKLLAFTIAAFFAGIAGGLYAHQTGILNAKIFGFNKSIEYLVIVVLGGMGSITGSIIASIILVTLPEMLRGLAEYRLIIYSLVLILMMLFRPSGLLGTREFSLLDFWEWAERFFRKVFKGKTSETKMPFTPRYDVWEEKPVLEICRLGISFGGLRAADDVNLCLMNNEIVGLIGPNGAGKTTIFNMLTGVYIPTDGDINLLGKRINGLAPHEITKNGIARTFQNIRLFKSMTVLENIKVAFHSRMHYSTLSGILRDSDCTSEERGIDIRARELLRVFQMEDVADAPSSSLPYGQQRKLEICRALASNPKVLLLDEPAAGMNPMETTELMQTIKTIRNRFSVAILLIEHDMKLVMGICERIYVLNYGKVIAEGTPEQIRNNPGVIAAYLGSADARPGSMGGLAHA
ncbi:MAG: branched-chain amino acid ABC transporter ATP-binding protein/permease [Clostridiales bacterium]|jgi:branched-chain amino acid transport system permease protein|nr:branched-chain amino acid ABC transporter ATP-binding protein/permease [Clostridiales bacterium]